MIPVTKPFFPPREKYDKYISEIWERQWLTNNGPVLVELEAGLKQYLNIPNLMFVANGTIAIQMAIKALKLTGEIITTPFSYVATTSTIVWENCRPVFVDIDPFTFTIDPGKIEAAITKNTSAILATHVFGNACDIDAIQAIADKHGLKIIYDAAHCFDTLYKGKSVFEFGDISTCSFHATKIFHTIEGGAVFSPQPELLTRISLLRNFGHTSPITFDGAGINAKNSEMHAAMGLCVLEYMGEIMKKRKEQWDRYKNMLQQSDKLQLIRITEGCDFNWSYFPVVFESEAVLLKVTEALNRHDVYPRRYFYPSLNTLDYIDKVSCPNSEAIASCVLCIPLYHTLSGEDQDMIADVIINSV